MGLIILKEKWMLKVCGEITLRGNIASGHNRISREESKNSRCTDIGPEEGESMILNRPGL